MASPTVLISVCAALGNGLQGWDNAALAGSLLYISRDFRLGPSLIGAVVSASLVGCVLSTFSSGVLADFCGRKRVLLLACFCYMLGTGINSWAANVFILIVGRMFVGVAIGLVATVVPMFISECSPPALRGQLSTLPQLIGITAMIFSYSTMFHISLESSPSWRLMLGIACVPSLLYLVVLLLVIPESPRWLAIKGKYVEARIVLQYLRGSADVEAEMKLLLEGLEGPRKVTLEEWVVKAQTDSDTLDAADEQQTVDSCPSILITDSGITLAAMPLHRDEFEAELQTDSNLLSESFKPDILVDLMDEVQRLGGTDAEQALASEHLKRGSSSVSNNSCRVVEDQDLHMPFLLDEAQEDPPELQSRDSVNSSSMFGSIPPLASMASAEVQSMQEIPQQAASVVGSEWQLMWPVDPERQASQVADGSEVASSQKRIYLLQSSIREINTSVGRDASEGITVPVLVSEAQADTADIPEGTEQGEKQGDLALAGGNLSSPGVRHALLIGVTLQSLQQACGVNAVMYFTPSILMASGATFLHKIGLSDESSSILAGGVTTLIMLPFIFVAMRLMDISGRRQLLLWTIPGMIVSLAILSGSSLIHLSESTQSLCSLLGLAAFCCSFVTGFGPIPNIICAEIFPTRVRGICVSLCGGASWLCTIAVSQAFPSLQHYIGLGGVFGMFCVMSIASWVFVYLQVPETKGLPLEVICDLFAAAAGKKHHSD